MKVGLCFGTSLPTPNLMELAAGEVSDGGKEKQSEGVPSRNSWAVETTSK
jgi:hypothetical protein